MVEQKYVDSEYLPASQFHGQSTLFDPRPRPVTWSPPRTTGAALYHGLTCCARGTVASRSEA
jgi:hypothetical protein